MRKFNAGLILLAFSAFFNGVCERPLMVPGAYAQQETAGQAAVKEDAQILYDEAVELKKQGNLAAAIESYAKAMRLDRSILAFDDFGLIEALKKDCVEKLAKTPDDVKLLETLGFVQAVCYSDHKAAIECYEKVFNLVTDPAVKERTGSLIERLRETEMVQTSFQQEMNAQLRDERLKSWSEMERVEKFGAESAAMQEKSAALAEAYKEKDSLANKVPQLENELKELKEDYDKADRLWYSLKDELYERRRRRLKDDVAAKEEELNKARKELEEVESKASSLERELNASEKEKEASPIRSYEENSSADQSEGQPADQPAEVDSAPAQPPSNDFGSPDAGQDGQALPADNPDFPADGAPAGEQPAQDATETAPAGNDDGAAGNEPSEQLDDLINNL